MTIPQERVNNPAYGIHTIVNESKINIILKITININTNG